MYWIFESYIYSKAKYSHTSHSNGTLYNKTHTDFIHIHDTPQQQHLH